LMDRLLGVSSHELYHFWNVCRIRPKELLPYDFSKEAYIDTGIVAEGVTTYMGDLFLWQSGYYADRDYLGILEKLINREFEQFGWKNHSVVESSWDLWLDGYKPGAPDRKVSIYNRGALLSLCLDLMLIRSESSLSQVMRMMWDNFGQRGLGYGLKDFQAIIAEEAKDTDVAEAFFAQFVYGTEHLLPTLRDCLASAGISLGEEKRNDFATGYGLILDEGTKVKSVHPHSPAYDKIMVGDMIQSQELQQSPAGNLLNLSIQRYGRDLEITLSKTADTYYNQYRLYIHSPKELSYWKNS
jgi:predicted metalloprotease with PDZ domain